LRTIQVKYHIKTHQWVLVYENNIK
jgi:hypothetical protein